MRLTAKEAENADLHTMKPKHTQPNSKNAPRLPSTALKAGCWKPHANGMHQAHACRRFVLGQSPDAVEACNIYRTYSFARAPSM